MHDDEIPREAIGRVLPDAEPPARFDLDQIITDGYRARRRHRVMLGGAATAGVAALAGALALSLTVSAEPDGHAAADGVPDQIGEPVPLSVDDPAMAGYPYSPDARFADGGLGVRIGEAVSDAFGDVLEEAGVASGEDALPARPIQRPGNYGQVWLRGYQVMAFTGGEEESSRPVLTIDAMMPGGWTGEPGPVTEQLFPQHLVGTGLFEDDDPVVEETDLGDGRTLRTEDRGCMLQALVVYPNSSGLLAEWNSCGAEAHETTLEDFTAAAVDMPQVNHDTSELEAVDELLEVPTGWLTGDWPQGDAEAGAEDTGAALASTLNDRYPGAGVIEESVGPMLVEGDYEAAVLRHEYAMAATLPFEAYAGQGDAHVNVTYTLPGGWLPGANEDGAPGPYLVECDGKLGIECEEVEVDGRNAIVQSSAESGVYEVTVFHEDGWAVNAFITFEGEFALGLGEFTELSAALPAPVFDADAEPMRPGE